MAIRIGYGVALLGAVTGCTVIPAPEGADVPDGGASGTPGSGATGGGGQSGSAGAAGGGGSSGMPPTGDWKNATSNLANIPSECGNVSFLSAKPDEDLLITVVAQKGLWESADGGQSWQALGDGAGSAVITNRMSWIAYDPADAKRFWESGIYNGGGVYETKDDGKTFAQLGDATHIDDVSVDFTDPARKVLLAGKHEAAQSVFRSEDGGGTWTNVGVSLPADGNCTFPLVIDAQTHLVGCWSKSAGIYRSTNAGQTWAQVSPEGGQGPALRASDHSLYWASSNDTGMVRSTDDGATWTEVVGAGVVRSMVPLELPDGRIATLSKDAVVASADHGTTWQPVSSQLPYGDASGVAYSVPQKAFFVWHFTCGFNGPVPVPADAIMRFDFDYTKG